MLPFLGVGLRIFSDVPVILNWVLAGMAGICLGTAVGVLQVVWFHGALRQRRQWVGASALAWLVAVLVGATWRTTTDTIFADALLIEIVLLLGSSISALLTSRLLHRGLFWSIAWVVTGVLSGRLGIWLGLGLGTIIVTTLIGDTPVDGIVILQYLASFLGFLVGIRINVGVVSAHIMIVSLVLLIGLPHAGLIWRAMPAKRRRAPTYEMLRSSVDAWVGRSWRLVVPVLGIAGVLLAALVIEPRREVEITFINRSAAPIDVDIVPRWTNGETGTKGEPLHLDPGEARTLLFAVGHSRIEWLWHGPTVFVGERNEANSCRHVTLFAVMRMGWQVDASLRRHCLVFHV